MAIRKSSVKQHPVSIIIPVGPNETQHEELIAQLEDKNCDVVVSKEETRSKALNIGAKKARRKFLWFLHADSRLKKTTFPRFISALESNQAKLNFCDLEFAEDGPGMTWLNALGARFRSRVLGVPFGDQGLCIRRDLFESIGGFPEDAPYGEDHLFVWKARHLRIPLHANGAPLITSARAYADQGWWDLTLKRQKQWITQAWPEWKKLKQR